ncbi:MAG: hypothetical protein NC299_16030 [Lachnospiraceae bacterium]|nr:hypothetical protein [Ruminococcus sp.]MCM1276844.1 hypothetical protein [Lachnospiraceae bacterium]
MLRAYFYKLIHSPLFYVGALASTALSFYGMRTHGGGSVFDDVDILIGLQNYRKMFVLFASLPFVSNFADEWNTKTVTNCVTRRDADSYAAANIVMCYLSAFAAVFIGIMIYVLFQLTQMPLYDENSFFPPYGALLEKAPMLAITAVAFVYASSCGMWAVMGLTASAFFPSKYAAFCAPFVFCYIIERFTEILPGEFQLGPLSKSWSDWKPLPAFLKSVMVFLTVSAVCGIIFTIKVKRRIGNELS